MHNQKLLREEQNNKMNKYKNSEKIKVSQLYHNYHISTKCFDGTTLYEMFLANHKPHAPTNNSIEIDSKKTNQTETDNEAKKEISAGRKIIEISPYKTTYASSEMQRTSDGKNHFIAKQITPDRARREHQSKETVYQRFYESLEATREKKITDQIKIALFQNRSKGANSAIRFRRSMSKKKMEVQVEDFLTQQQIEFEPLTEEKLGGYTASSITVLNKSKRIYSYSGEFVREIASLTKIMTCVVCLYLAKKFEIDIEKKQMRVSRVASLIPGTTAELKNGDIVSLQDLLYGMMLPSGNDAAYALAEFFSRVMMEKNEKNEKKLFDTKKEERKNRYKTVQIARKPLSSSNHPVSVKEFISEMNKMAAHLKMSRTNFHNPHGLSDSRNTSTSNDIGELCYYAMKNEQFRQIVKTKQYDAKIFSAHQKMKRSIKWENTNKLLDLEHCFGIKTGVTPSAGPCMSAFFSSGDFEAIIVILNTKNKASRFQEVKKLFQWAMNEAKK